MKAFQFGAGNIGRGFLGQLFFESGYRTTFIDVVDAVVEGLQKRESYPIHLVSDETTKIEVRNVTAVHAGDMDAVARVVAESDIGATAVGVSVLPRIAPALAGGIALRFSDPAAPPLNVIICENMIGAGSFLREQVRAALDPTHHAALDEKVGFVEASIGRMVPVMTERERSIDPLLVCVEPYCELPVDRAGFRGEIPEIAHMKALDNFQGYVERKLFVHNMSHATAAYLGRLRGHEYIWQTVGDAAIRKEVEGALFEACRGLVAKHGLDPVDLHAHAEDLLDRYANRALGDQVARIAKDPIRKLGPNDRLIGTGLMCLDQGVEPRHVALGAAAALLYDHPDDPAAIEVQRVRTEHGPEEALRTFCHLDPNHELARLILEQLGRLQRGEWPG